MEEKDIITRKYLSDGERFADIMNAGLFHGRPVLKGQDLRSIDGYSSVVYTRRGKQAAIHRQRDIIKKSAYGANFVLLGIEEQSNVHYAMPLRIMGYDFLEYEEQFQQLRRIHRKKKDLSGAEYLSGFAKTDHLKPVLTMVLYCGERPWDGPQCLSQMLDWTGIPQEIRERTGEYAIHILDVRRFKESERLQTDARIVFGFLQRQDRGEELWDYINENQEAFSRMDEEAYDMINVWSRSHDLFPAKKNYKREDGRVNLCKALRDMKETERREGRKEGRAEGEREGQERLNALYQRLKAQGRMEDVLRAIDDADYRQDLLAEELTLKK